MNDRVSASSSAQAASKPLVLDDGVVWPEDAIEVGRIVDAWGVKGGIKVQPFSSDPQALFCTKKWFLRPAETAAGALPRPPGASKASGTPAARAARLTAPRFLQIKQAKEQGDVVVATAEGLDDRNQAEALKGATVFVSRAAFPTPQEDEYYWIDLIGLDVFNREGEALGKVVDLMDTGPTCVLRCVSDPVAPADSAAAQEAADGDAPGAGSAKSAPAEPVERLIPFVSAYIVSVSLTDKRIVADWGLDY